MKKGLYLIAAALMFAACAKEETEVIVPSHNVEGKTITIGASFELPTSGTKSDIDDNGNFTWSTGDAIWIGSDATSATSNWGKLDIQEGTGEIGPGYKSASFEGTLFGEYTAVASVFPATVQPSYAASTGKLSLTLPTTIAWNDSDNDNNAETMQADNVMVARYVDIYSDGGYSHGTTTGLQFYNVGGLFRLTLKNIPTSACKLVFTTDKKINGSFEVGEVEENSVNYPVINTEDTETESEKSVEISFTTITEGTNKRVFFIPVPVGSYQIGFAVKDASDNILWQFSTSKTNSVARGHMVKMPTLSHVVVSGDGDGATNIIVTPTSFSGNVYLPSTENDVYVKMNETDGTINLEYSQTGDLKPANVYLQALGDITTLNINLPETHVQLTGEENIHTLTNVSANTSVSTFVVDNLVKIGKDDVATSGLTITGGSLDLSAPVAGTVTVAIPEETVNATEERVSISIGSAINNLVVTRAATQDAPDKIYVSLGAQSSVTETISVPETNCNLYVAPGASVKVVETNAAENTIEGSVETLSGSGTTVTVTKDATVTSAITASDNATIIVHENAVTGNPTQTEDGGTITSTTVDDVVAMIGNTAYSSLADAIAAVQGGETITMVADVASAAGMTVAEGKNFTVDFNNHTYTLNKPGAGSSGTETNGFQLLKGSTITFKNGTINISEENLATATSGYNVKRVIQNYADLTLDNMTIDGTNQYSKKDYVVSFNNGTSVIKDTKIKGADNSKVIFDVCTWATYVATSVTVSGSSVIDGNIEVSATNTPETLALTLTGGTHNGSLVMGTGADKATITKSDSFSEDAPEGYSWKSNGNGTSTLAEDVFVAQIGSTTYATLEAAFDAAVNGNTITLLSDVVLTETLVNSKNVVLDLGEYSISGAVGAGTAAQSEEGKLILNRGHLTINSANNKGRIWNTNIDAQGRDAVYNAENATIIINGGVFGDKDIDTANENADINRGMALRNYGTAVLNGGKFTAADNFTTGGGYAYSIVNYGGTMTIKDGVEVYGRNNGNLSVNGGEVIVEGGLFTANAEKIHYNIYLTAGGTMTVNGGTFTKGPLKGSNALSIYKSGGDLNITGGTFNKLTDGALANTADGISITGGTFTVDPSAYVADGYEAVDNGNGTWTVQEFQGVAQIGSSYYKTLAEAFAAVPTDGTKTTIQMIADETMATGATLEVAATKNIVLDLNGKTVSGNGGVNGADFFFLTNRGTLEITDSSTGGKITGYWTNPNTGYSNQYNTIYNIDGKLTLSAGTVETTSGYLSYAINNSSNAWGVGDDKETVFTMTGGTVTAPSGDAAVRVYQNCGSNSNPYSHNTVNITGGLIKDNGIFVDTFIYKANPASSGDHILTSINISGGEIHGLLDMKMRHAYNTSLNITGGTFVDTKLWVRKYANEWGTGLAEPSSPIVNISGGNFSFVSGKAFGLAYDCSGTSWTSYTNPYSVTGGTFNTDPSAYVANGYEAVQSGNNWNVVKATPLVTVGEGGQYETLADAISAAESGSIVKLVSDISVSSATSLSKDITLDLNGNTITSSAILFNIYGNYNLTIKDSGENGAIDVAKDKIVYVSNGKLTLEGGALSVHSSSTYTYGVQVGSSGAFEMNGGSITIPATSTSTYNYCVSSSGGNVTINGGEMSAEASGGNYAVGASAGTTTINGGTIIAKYSNSGYGYSPYTLYPSSSGKIIVNGGYFKAIGNKDLVLAGHLVSDSAAASNASISGGYFGGDYYYGLDATKWIADGHNVRQLTDSETDSTNAAAKAAGYKFVVE